MRGPLLALAAAVAPAPARGDCYAANTTAFGHCSGYEVAGYNCSADGVSCASSSCLASCGFCALHYRDAVLDAATGRCCDSVDDGACRGAKSGVVHNVAYGLPDHKPHAIFEGCSAYPHGPQLWSPDSPSGSYGFTMNFPPATGGKCPPVPAQFDPARVHAASLRASGPPVDGCFLACNVTEVAASGDDPCAVGSVTSPTAGHGAMSCYSGGDMWLKKYAPHTGMCAFNCTLRQDSSHYCTNNTPPSNCFLTCSDSLL